MLRSKIFPATRATLSRSTYGFAATPSAASRRPTNFTPRLTYGFTPRLTYGFTPRLTYGFTRGNHNTPQNNDHNWPKVASDVVWWGGIVGLMYVMTHPFL